MTSVSEFFFYLRDRAKITLRNIALADSIEEVRQAHFSSWPKRISGDQLLVIAKFGPGSKTRQVG